MIVNLNFVTTIIVALHVLFLLILVSTKLDVTAKVVMNVNQTHAFLINAQLQAAVILILNTVPMTRIAVQGYVRIIYVSLTAMAPILLDPILIPPAIVLTIQNVLHHTVKEISVSLLALRTLLLALSLINVSAQIALNVFLVFAQEMYV